MVPCRLRRPQSGSALVAQLEWPLRRWLNLVAWRRQQQRAQQCNSKNLQFLCAALARWGSKLWSSAARLTSRASRRLCGGVGCNAGKSPELCVQACESMAAPKRLRRRERAVRAAVAPVEDWAESSREREAGSGGTSAALAWMWQLRVSRALAASGTAKRAKRMIVPSGRS